MQVKKWIENKTFDDVTNDDNAIVKGTTIKFLLQTKYSNYTMLYDTVSDNNNMYGGYVEYIKPQLIEIYNTMYLIGDFNPLEENETVTSETTYGKTVNTTNGYTKTNTGTQTNVTDSTVTDSSTSSGTSTNETSTYNTNTFENDVKNTSSGTVSNTNDTDSTVTTTNNLSETNSGTGENVSSGKDTTVKTIEKTNDNLFNDYINNKLKWIDISVSNYFVEKFIEIAAYLESGVFIE